MVIEPPPELSGLPEWQVMQVDSLGEPEYPAFPLLDKISEVVIIKIRIADAYISACFFITLIISYSMINWNKGKEYKYFLFSTKKGKYRMNLYIQKNSIKINYRVYFVFMWVTNSMLLF